MVQSLLDDPSNDYGFVLVPAGNIFVKTASGESANGPTLSVEVEGPPPPDPLVIENVFINGEELSVSGQNFDNGDVPFVSLSGIGVLSTLDSNASGMTAFLPAALQEDGDYLLTVTTGSGPGQVATFDLTIGAVGTQGPPGPQGPQGPQGETGEQGPAGVAGPIGPTGPEGAGGATGPQGETGEQGPAGVAGPIGPTGPEGAGGATGPQGDTGAPGPMGLMGPPGVPGSTGADGPAGPAGVAGVPGPMGPEGVAGATGPQGPPGPGGSGLAGYEVIQDCGPLVTLSPGQNHSRATLCPAGKKLTGGGGWGGHPNNVIQRSHPNGASWLMTFKNVGSSSSIGTLCVWVVCASVDAE